MIEIILLLLLFTVLCLAEFDAVFNNTLKYFFCVFHGVGVISILLFLLNIELQVLAVIGLIFYCIRFASVTVIEMKNPIQCSLLSLVSLLMMYFYMGVI